MARATPAKERTGYIVSQEQAYQLQTEDSGIEVLWGGKQKPWFDWQERFLQSIIDEIGLFGGKVGGKSVGLRAKMVSGNPELPDEDEDGQPILVNQSYTNHPDYYGLILRRNQKDLEFFLLQAQRMWAPFGCEFRNGAFVFPSGARIDCGHMADESAWMKYIGNEFQRVAIDEAGLIPDYGLIEEMRSCMRTPHPQMRIQLFYASNSGGPGTSWIVDRFMTVKDAHGEVIPHDTVISEKVNHPFTGEEEIRTRIWMFSSVKDNLVMRDTRYATELANLQDPKRRAAYFEGRWDALFGSYFGDLFRPDGPVKANNEPANARHVISEKEVRLQPHWHRCIGMDWGWNHESAILWACTAPDGRIYIYREMVAAETSPVRWGFEIAQATRAELEASPSKTMTLHLSHDAFNSRAGEKSYAELVAMGMMKVLGSHAVHVPDIIIRNLQRSYEQELFTPFGMEEREKAMEQLRMQKRIGITIRIAPKLNPIIWQHCRETLRFESIGKANAQYDHKVAFRLLQEDPRAFEEYCTLYRDVQPEALPKLQIFRERCPRLIDAIPKVQHEEGTENVSKDHFKGKDVVDCWGYTIGGLHDEQPQEPFETFRERRVEETMRMEPNMTVADLIRTNEFLEKEWKNKGTLAPYTPPRQARLGRLIRMGKLETKTNAYKRF